MLEPCVGYPPLLLRARVSVSCADLGAPAGGMPSPLFRSEPLQEAGRRMRVMHERVAGTMLYEIRAARRTRSGA